MRLERRDGGVRQQHLLRRRAHAEDGQRGHGPQEGHHLHHPHQAIAGVCMFLHVIYVVALVVPVLVVVVVVDVVCRS